ncbi:MAG: NAD(P)-binding domain-containing protein [Candidatus Lokiarchaeota archaeon]|nr:NAD(P)-binding domain-containing protein [Candidatus Lokiarchaeota archaeon]
MEKINKINTIIVGGGQSGLSVSYFLKKEGIDHIILEKADKPAFAWREQKWDSFTFVTPSSMINLPGITYKDFNFHPDEFLPKEEIIKYFEDYIEINKFPIQFNIEVTDISKIDSKWVVKTSNGDYIAQNVVIATGFFQTPKKLDIMESINPAILQLHSSEYKNVKSVKEGNVLVVGSGQSGMQIAEELYKSGKKLFLAIGNTKRIPRSYRGKDLTNWMIKLKMFDKTVDELDDLSERLVGNAHVSGANGGHTVNLHKYAKDGVILLAKINRTNDFKVYLDKNLHQLLTNADSLEKTLLPAIDKIIEKDNLDAPEEDLEVLDDGFKQEIVEELDLKESNINTIIWATGYARDYSFIKTDKKIIDKMGFPIQKRGVTEEDGLFFIGTVWLYKTASSLLYGVGEDAEHLVKQLKNRK